MADLTEDQLVAIAMQLCARVRDDHPEANGRWLTAVAPDPENWWRLLFILAAAVPDDQTWSELTGWINQPAVEGLRPCGTRSAYERHRARGEDVDEACHEAYRAYAIVKQVKARQPKPAAPIVTGVSDRRPRPNPSDPGTTVAA